MGTMKMRATVFVTASLLLNLSSAIFVVEKGGLKIKFPIDAAKQHPDGFEMALGNFGQPLYGGVLTGQLIYVDSSHGYDNSCTPDCRYACQSYQDARPALELDRSKQYVMLVDRGPGDATRAESACLFVEKAWNAQKAGVAALLVVNYDDSHVVMGTPDEDDEYDEDKKIRYLRNITIPAAFIDKTTGDTLKSLVRSGASDAYVVMDWTDVLPRANKVEWQFWSRSNDMCGAKCDVEKEFIKQFVPVAKELEGTWTRFQPHYLTSSCPPYYRNTKDCESQCIHKVCFIIFDSGLAQRFGFDGLSFSLPTGRDTSKFLAGRYCAPDPDGSIEEGYSGSEVVQENLRQLCVFQLGNASGKPWVWWDYVTKFGEECTMSAKQYSRECAERVFSEIGGPQWSSLADFRNCAGGIDEDRQNELLEQEVASQRDSGHGEVTILPTIRINEGQYRGRLAYSDVLRAICAGFTRKAEPPVCLRITEDACQPGLPGDMACRASTDGKTKCQTTFSGYECHCGNCYTEILDTAGGMTCKKKCDLDNCDENTGICTGTGSAGMAAWAVVLIVSIGLGLLGGIGYAAYKWRLRQEMRDEVKSILKQYMPLAETEEKEVDSRRLNDF